MKIKYIDKRFGEVTLDVINLANSIIEEYKQYGIDFTVRGLYYKVVAKGEDVMSDLGFPIDKVTGSHNNIKAYKRFGSIISNARLAGLVDWYAIEDEVRRLESNYHNTDPGQAVQDALDQFLLNKWDEQQYRPEVWIEKQALIGTIKGTCRNLDVPYFACKGYNSQSEMWKASQRFDRYRSNGQTPVVIHLGDHDPSGLDMTRDIRERLELFVGKVDVVRIALSYDQVEKYNCPPNPSKLTDTRAASYIGEYGHSSWELDALEPFVVQDLINETVAKFTNDEILDQTIDREDEYKKVLENVAMNWRNI